VVVWKERAGCAAVAAVIRLEDEDVVDHTSVDEVNGLAADDFDFVNV
jgi:hypothetical protein